MVKVRGLVLLTGILLVCLVFLTLQSRGRSSSAGDMVAVVTTPVQTVLARINRTAFGLWSTYRDWKNVRVENVPDATIVRRFRRYGPYAGLAFWLLLTRDWVPE